MYHKYVRNAVLDVCAKSVPVWGKSGEMRGLLRGSKIILTSPLSNIPVEISGILLETTGIPVGFHKFQLS